MSTKLDKFEQDILKEIQSLTEADKITKSQKLSEGFLEKLFGMLAAKPMTRALGKAMKIANKDPEVKSALADFQAQRQRTIEKLANYCDRNPDSPMCYGAWAEKYGFDFNPKRKKGDRSRWTHKGKRYRR